MIRANAGTASPAFETQRSAIGGAFGRVAALLRGVTQPQTRSLRHVETLHLGPKRTLFLVECDGHRFLLGSGSDGIHAILPLNQQDTTSRNVDAGESTP